MVMLPGFMPLSTPVVASIDPINGLLLLHTPPATGSVSVVVEPAIIWVTPDIAPGAGFTVTVFVVVQPAAEVKVIVTVPAVTPHTTPVVEPAVAMAASLLTHKPLVTSV